MATQRERVRLNWEELKTARKWARPNRVTGSTGLGGHTDLSAQEPRRNIALVA